jgi:hypothetical protein
LFCYRRSHLHALAIAIAGSCNERDLIQFGGRVGAALYDLSRSAPASRGAQSSHGGRKPVTLSTKPLTTLAPLEDIEDDEQQPQVVMA